MFARLCIVASCVAQFQREGAGTSDAVLQRYFDTLPKEEQDTLLQFGASEFKSQLRLQQLEQDPDIKELNSLTPNFSAAKLMMKRMAEGRPFFQPGENGGLMGPPRDREGGPRYDLRREGDRPGRPGNDRPGPRFGEGPRPPRPGDRPGEPPREGESRPPPPDENGPQ